MVFIGREEEQKAINRLLSQKGYRGCILYGRRRRGKTELVRHTLSDKGVPLILYQCKESSERDNVSLISKRIQKELNLPNILFNSFFDAVEFLFDYSLDRPIYLVLDEYPYIRSVIEGCDSKLQAIIDRYARKSNLKLFVLGSSIATREDVLSHENPLYRRFHLSILLQQRDYFDSAKFYPAFGLEDKVRLYSAFGGVPFYNAQIDANKSVKENIVSLLSGRFSGLREFLETYLKQELRKVNRANLVFDSIALGAFHYQDILSKSHIDSSPRLSAILQKLVKRNLIEYVAPINKPTDKKKSGYRISDACVRFYYRYLYRNESALNRFDDDVFYDRYVSKDFERTIVPATFETITKQFLIRKNRKGRLNPSLLDIGTYWYDNPKEKKNGQFDVVGKCQNGYVFFECKYTNAPINDQVISEELEQISCTTLAPIQYGFASKNGFDLKKEYPYLFFTLEDRYKE